MDLPEPFTKQIEHLGAGPPRIALFQNGAIILVEELIHYDKEDFDGCVPCNALADDPNNEYLSDPLLSSLGGEIQLPDILAGWAGGGDAPLAGLTFGQAYSQNDAVNFGVELDNEYIGKYTSRLRWKNYTKAQLGSNTEKIVSEDGVVDGLTINIIDNNLELPDWDKFFDLDTYLENSENTCIPNSYGLTIDKHCEVCKERRSKYIVRDLTAAAECFRDACGQWESYRHEQQYYDSCFPEEEEEEVLLIVNPTYDCYCLEPGSKLDYYPSLDFQEPVGSTVLSYEVLRDGHMGVDPSRGYCIYQLQTPTEQRYFDTSLASIGSEDGEIMNLKKTCIPQGSVYITDSVVGPAGETVLNIDSFNSSIHADLALLNYSITSVNTTDPASITFASINDNTKTVKLAWVSTAPPDTEFNITVEYTYSECTPVDEAELRPDADALSRFLSSEAENKENLIVHPCSFEEIEGVTNKSEDYYDYDACTSFDVRPGPRGGKNETPDTDACSDIGRNDPDPAAWESCIEQYAYITNKYWDCYDDCGSSDGSYGTDCFKQSDGENRVDIASDICHCGGKYKNETTKCGYQAIMNK